MRFIVMFVAAVCVLFLIKLRWPKKKEEAKLTWVALEGYVFLFSFKSLAAVSFKHIIIASFHRGCILAFLRFPSVCPLCSSGLDAPRLCVFW